jgi:hypothetical protein
MAMDILPHPLPDETLYGLLARANMACAGDISQRDRSIQLDELFLPNHDFPHHLECLHDITQGLLGTPDEIAVRYTTAPYFSRFRSRDSQERIIEILKGGNISLLKRQLGLPASPSRASQPLRACSQCLIEDEKSFGLASWRRAHQLPGSLVCSLHSISLVELSVRVNRLDKGQYLLPAVACSGIGQLETPNTVRAVQMLGQLAKLNETVLANCHSVEYSRDLMHQVYRFGLRAHGLLTSGGLVRAADFMGWLHSYYEPIKDLRPFTYAFSGSHHETLLRMVRKPRLDFHSLYHVLLINAIFGGWDAFLQACHWQKTMETGVATASSEAGSLNMPDSVKAVISAYQAPDNVESIRDLAKRHCTSPSTVMRWAGRAGIVDLPRRPKALHHELKSQVIEALIAGEPQREIAKRTGLSKATIDRVCQESPERYAAWKTANHEWRRARARKSFFAYLASKPTATAAEIRSVSPEGYCWLKRHDSAWLGASMPATKRLAQPTLEGRHSRSIVDWAARDEDCFKELALVASTLLFESWERMKPGALIRRIKNLSFSPRLERLPRSQSLATMILDAHRYKQQSKPGSKCR